MMKYRVEIDGLRAIAITSVILFHAGYKTFSGGYIGVDIFFVISGYLISSIILNDLKTNSFSYKTFYEKRIRRILPALLLVCLTFALPAWFLLPAKESQSFYKSLLSVIFFTSNIYAYRHSSYFDVDSDLTPLIHTWSLAVEEQFYLFFPLLLVLLYKFVPKFSLHILISLLLISLFTANTLVSTSPEEAFFLIHTRAWELLIGAITSILLLHKAITSNRIVNEFLACTGLLLILLSIFIYDAETPIPSFYTLIPTLGTAFVIASSSQTITNRALGYKYLTTIGLMSYSLYLWHQPILAFARHLLDDQFNSATQVLCLALISTLSFLSWKFIEIRFRQKNVIKNDELIRVVTLSVLILIAIGFIGSNTNFVKKHHAHGTILKSTTRNLHNSMIQTNCNIWHSPKYNNLDTNRLVDCQRDNKQTVFLFGDSHALNLHNILSQIANKKFTLVTFASGGCRLTDFKYTECKILFEEFQKVTSHYANQNSLIIYHQAGSQFISDKDGNMAPNDSSKFGQSNSVILSNEVSHVYEKLSELQKIAPIAWIGPWPEPRDHNLKEFNKNSIVYFKKLDAEISTQALRYNTVNYLSMIKILGQDVYKIKNHECLIFQDLNHYSECGEKEVSLKFSRPILLKLGIESH